MVGTIVPLVQVAKGRALRALVTHSVGSIVGGTTFGAWLGLMGAAVLAPAGDVVLISLYLLLAGVAAIYAASELGVVKVPLIERRAQVPETWRRTYGAEIGMLAYGLMLGAGFFTFVVSPVMYVAFGLALLSMSPLAGALIGLTYGVARIVPMIPPTIVAVTSKRNLSARDLVSWGLARFPFGIASGLLLAGATGMLIRTV